MVVKTPHGDFEVSPITFSERRKLHKKEVKVYWDEELNTDAYYDLLDWIMNKAFRNPEKSLGKLEDHQVDEVLSAIYQEYKGISKKKS